MTTWNVFKKRSKIGTIQFPSTFHCDDAFLVMEELEKAGHSQVKDDWEVDDGFANDEGFMEVYSQPNCDIELVLTTKGDLTHYDKIMKELV